VALKFDQVEARLLGRCGRLALLALELVDPRLRDAAALGEFGQGLGCGRSVVAHGN
jgi:hypothetical protein